MTTTITMPQLGESVAEGEVGKWLVKEGQRVEKDQPLVEILTDKADSEIPASESGVVTKIYVTEGATIAVGARLCEIDAAAQASATQAEGAQASATRSAATGMAATPSARAQAAESKDGNGQRGAGQVAANSKASPAVRKLARESGVDLGTVDGSGDAGRITKDDVIAAATRMAATEPGLGPSAGTTSAAHLAPAASGAAPAAPVRVSGPSGAFRLPPYVQASGDEIVPFSRRRRIIADHMVYSKLTSPHVVTFAECDLHRTAKIRDRHKAELKALGLNLTYLSFIAAATVRALREFRELNARVLDDAYVLLRDINLGVAVDTEDGLVVPVIANADELSVRGLARAIEEIAAKARAGKLAPDDLSGKSFTISNPGRQGNLVGGAIISQPNVGILRVGEIKKRVVVVERDGEDQMAIHPVMYMALSYDHRMVDGVHANGFLWRISQLLEEGDFEV